MSAGLAIAHRETGALTTADSSASSSGAHVQQVANELSDVQALGPSLGDLCRRANRYPCPS